nr:auxin response factor 4-like [Arachis hypogaea]
MVFLSLLLVTRVVIPISFLLWPNAISAKSMFHVFYSPRATHADFVVSYQKYAKSIKNPVTIGTRFKVKFEMDESPERRCTSGIVTGMSDLDPYRWPKSKWSPKSKVTGTRPDVKNLILGKQMRNGKI